MLQKIIKFDTHLQEVIKGSILAFFFKIISAALAFGFNVLIARMLGAEGAGVYYLCFSIMTVAATIGSFGLNNAVLRFVASMSAEQNWVAVNGVFNKSLWMGFCCSVLVTFVLYAIAPYLAINVFSTPELTDLLPWMSLAIMPLCMAQIYAHGLKGLKILRPALIVEGICIFLFSIVCMIVFVPIFGLLGVVWSYVIANCLTALIGILYWYRFNMSLHKVKGFFLSKQLLGSSFPLFWAAIFSLIANQAATFFLGVWGTHEEIGVFNVAFRCANLISFVLVSVNQVVAPRFAALYQQGDILALEKIAQKSTKLMILFASPLLILMLVYPDWIMGLFGEEFKQNSVILLILAIGQFINVAAGSVGFLLAMTGHESLLSKVTLLNTLISMVLLVVFIGSMGIKGAAIATSITVILQNLLMAWLVKKKLNINILSFKG